MITFGIIIGIFSKYSDTSGKIISHYFGILSSGIFFWFFIATLILYLSKTRKLFNLYYLSFMGSMLVSYYLYSKYVIGYYYSKIVWFWIIMLFITAIIGYIIINKVSNKKIEKEIKIKKIVFKDNISQEMYEDLKIGIISYDKYKIFKKTLKIKKMF